jgi:outer membrane protein TolC
VKRVVPQKSRRAGVRGAVVVALLAFAAPLYAQPPTPAERVTFREAIARATERNPSVKIAAAGILRAQGLLAQTRAATRPQINGNVTSTTLNRGVKFEDTTVTPQSSVTATLDLRMPLYAPALWAQRAEAQEAIEVAALSVAEAKRQTALATADAYLTILARRRVVDVNTRAGVTARAHCDQATQLEEQGAGSRLNRLRAQQELSVTEGQTESARLALYRAQEALGVLLVADGPVDAADEPDFSPRMETGSAATLMGRSDLKLFAAQQTQAEHVLDNAAKSKLPFFQGIFQPQSTYPSQFFTPSNTWRLLLQVDVPIFDSGARAADRVVRQSSLDVTRATLAGATSSATSEVRAAREAVASAGRELASAQAAASQAQEVVTIVNVSFRAGAATNIEVIDAERTARDAETSVVVSEDTLRRARFELLNALGQFP